MMESMQASVDLLAAVTAVQRQFIAAVDPRPAFEGALALLLEWSDSQFGTIGQVMHSPHGQPYLRTFAISNIAWDDASRQFHDAYVERGLEFHNLNNLLGEVILTGQAVVSNSPADDPRSGGVPAGHPAIESCLGIPFFGTDDEIVGMAALANRPGGYDQGLVTRLEPLCDALGVMVVAAQREHRRWEAGATLREREAALRASEARYRVLAEYTLDGLFLHGPGGRIVDVNRRACESLGYERDELIGMYPSDFDPEITLDDVESIVGRMRAGEGATFESRHRRKDGSEFPVEIRMRPFWLDGEFYSLALACDITERKRSEEALRRSEYELAEAQRVARLGSWSYEIDTDVVRWSDELYRIFDVEKEEFRGTYQSFLSRVHPDDRNLILQVNNDARTRGEPFAVEYRILTRSGELKYIREVGYARKDNVGAVSGLFGTAQDITERKLAEDTIRQIIEGIAPTTGHNFFRTLVGHLCQACGIQFASIAEIDPADPNRARTIAVSRLGELISNFEYDLRGTPCEHVLRRSICYYSPRVQQEFPRDTLLKELGIESYMGTPLFSSSGEVLGLIALLHNRPFAQPKRAKAILQVVAARAGAELERKRAEEALHASRHFIERIAAASPHIMYVFDRLRQQAVYANRPPAADLGYSPEEIAAHGEKTFHYLLHPDDVLRLPALLERWDTANDDEILTTEYRMQHRDGTWHWFLGHDTVFTRTPDGRVEQVIGTAQDITKWKEAEEELAVRQAELVHASRLSTVGRMVAALSHEVAQPLNATGNYAAACQQILDSERDDQRASLREYVNSIVKQNQRCGQILKRLRDFSRRTPAQRSKCDIAHLLRDATELVSFELRRDKVSVRFELASGLQTLWCDRIQLQQVVVNLLTNARDAVRKQEIARREIEVRASAANGAAVIEVDDLGSGLSSDMAARMFEPFYTTKEQGMGIGLSICQSIVKEHGGQIEAYSNRSGGTTVRITIPFDRSDKND